NHPRKSVHEYTPRRPDCISTRHRRRLAWHPGYRGAVPAPAVAAPLGGTASGSKRFPVLPDRRPLFLNHRTEGSATARATETAAGIYLIVGQIFVPTIS